MGVFWSIGIIAASQNGNLKLITYTAEFFCTQRSSGNVPLIVFWDGHGTVGFPIHSFSTFERIKKYDGNEDAGNIGKPYSIEVCDTPRWINLYVAASEDVYFSYGSKELSLYIYSWTS